MAKLAVGYGCPEVLAFTEALGIPSGVDICAIDIRIRPDEVVMATLEVPVSGEALSTLRTLAERSEGRIKIENETKTVRVVCSSCAWRGEKPETTLANDDRQCPKCGRRCCRE